ncbi:hypothetical protein HGRIS_010913 [Hohenbuehelia grisea]|uniref:Uncharacterized protein n=1 Tax=Hohenbuehelia grisea TaxID=104357 RepID=A0ABR3IZ06_9AGAR
MIAEDTQPDDHLGNLQSIWLVFEHHKIFDTAEALNCYEKDSRHALFDRGPKAWAAVLHIKLAKAGLGQMLFDLSRQVQPEYVYLVPDLADKHADHLHEAMQRILLKYILPLWNTDGIPLYKSIHRSVPEIIKSAEYAYTNGRPQEFKAPNEADTKKRGLCCIFPPSYVTSEIPVLAGF